MPKYIYIAVDKQNDSIHGTIEASDKASALSNIKSQDLQPISVREADTTGLKSFSIGNFLRNRKVKSDDLVMFTRQLSAMVGAGVPLLRAINSLQEHTTSQKLKGALEEVSKGVQAGATLADSLEKHPDIFNDIYINMVRAGEAAGILDDILKRLALQQEKNATIRKKVKSSMTYPIVLIAITIIAFFGLMLFVIPQIGTILKDLGGEDAKLPALTRAMLAISGFMATYWFIVIPAIIAAVTLLLKYIKTPRGKSQFHHLILKIPGVKDIAIKVAISHFARTFSALMGAGVAVLEALSVTSRAVGNVVYEQTLAEATESVKNGATLSSVIADNPLFPSIVSQMLAVGEETGQTDTVLLKVADFYEEEVDASINGISSIIEPVMIVVMGGMVGIIAASVMMPIAGLAQNIKG